MAHSQAGADVANVVNRCNSAKQDKKLDLSGCKLIQIPEAVYFLMKNVCVESLVLSNNQIPRLPKKFGVVFPGISELCLKKNKFSSLPDELQDLTNLQSLDISFNSFTCIPNAVYRLPKLVNLNAENNSITDVDQEKLEGMASIEEVNLCNNPIPADQQRALQDIAEIHVLVGS
ncbi:leucine-rich repeat-containing protein 40 [Octopus sinensis]|uniref:Leucine-rich repeat-containing protein 40 n=1 Tax=Octopus sinensis TaxID=2607531 RepID=A0A6P7SB07_9MOLL|nr:leucine-rich repeat-containing protein 40 [Octopus sinensis]